MTRDHEIDAPRPRWDKGGLFMALGFIPDITDYS